MAAKYMEYVGETGELYLASPEELGAGCFGQVICGTRKSDGLQVAIKRMENPSAMALECAATEQEVMKTLRYAGGHENLMALVDLATEAGSDVLLIVAERLHCDMIKWLPRVRASLTPGAKAEIVRQFYAGLAFMHSHGIVHADVHPGNVLIDKRRGLIQIGDFGNSELCKGPRQDLARITDLRDGATKVAAPLWLQRMYNRGSERQAALDGFSPAFGRYTPEVVNCVFSRYVLEDNFKRSANWWAEAHGEVCGAIKAVNTWNMQTPNAAGVPVPDDVAGILTVSMSFAPYEEVTAENISALFEQLVPQDARDSAREIIRTA